MVHFRLPSLIMLIIVLAVVSSCGSSRQASKRPHPKERPEQFDINTDRLHGDGKLLVDEALTWLGTRYRYGGKDYTGTDCSGLTMQVYKKALGISLPRTSRDQQSFCKSIKRSGLQPGDLVFFATGRDKRKVSHVGIYIGEDRIIHSSSSRGVIISHLDERYYTSNYHSSGHVVRKDATRTDPTSTMPGEKPQAMPTPPPKKKTPVNKVGEITLERLTQSSKKAAADSVTKAAAEELQITIDEIVEAEVDSVYTQFLD